MSDDRFSQDIGAELRAATNRIVRAITVATFFICFAADASLRADASRFFDGMWTLLLDIIGLCWALLNLLLAYLGWNWSVIAGSVFLAFFIAIVGFAVLSWAAFFVRAILRAARKRRPVEPLSSASPRHDRIDPTV